MAHAMIYISIAMLLVAFAVARRGLGLLGTSLFVAALASAFIGGPLVGVVLTVLTVGYIVLIRTRSNDMAWLRRVIGQYQELRRATPALPEDEACRLVLRSYVAADPVARARLMQRFSSLDEYMSNDVAAALTLRTLCQKVIYSRHSGTATSALALAKKVSMVDDALEKYASHREAGPGQ